MKKIFITGSTQGIGLETAQQLLSQGHQVVGHARTAEKALALKSQESRFHSVLVGDLDIMASTKSLAIAANKLGSFDVIIHNAGLGGGAKFRESTGDNLEKIFHTNVVAPFILTCGMPLAPRMIFLTSGLEGNGKTNLDDLNWTQREWNGMQAYSDSKLYDSMLAFELAARHPEIIVTAVDPGWIKTRMGGPSAPDPLNLGAETQVWLATSLEQTALQSGKYFKRKEVHVPNPETQDAVLRNGLVGSLEGITGLRFP